MIQRKDSATLRVQGSYDFDTDVQTVWDAMQSPEVLSGCISGCESFEPAGEGRYTVQMRVRVSAITGSYKGEVKMENIDYLKSYTMVVEGSGRGGTVKGEGDLVFSESEGRTSIQIAGDVQVTGIIARVGQRLLGGASRMMMNQFFDCLKTKIEEG